MSLKTILKAGYGDKNSKMVLKPMRENDLSNKNNQIYYDKSNNKLIQNVKGTNPFSLQDIGTDIYLGLGKLKDTNRFKESKRILEKAKQKYPNAKTTVVGHSLGKNIAELISDKKKDNFVGVNGYYQPFTGTTSNNGRFKNYRNQFDVVSLFGANKTNVRNLRSSNNALSLLNNHSVDSLPNNIFV